jgi:hypothetical protein
VDFCHFRSIYLSAVLTFPLNEAEIIGGFNTHYGGPETTHAAISSAPTFIAGASCMRSRTCLSTALSRPTLAYFVADLPDDFKVARKNVIWAQWLAPRTSSARAVFRPGTDLPAADITAVIERRLPQV